MPEFITFGELKNSTVPDVAGVCASTDQFKQYVNQAVRMLMRRGGWAGTVARMHTCIRGDCAVWPREVETVLAISSCGRNFPVRDYWYSFLPIQKSDFFGGPFFFNNGTFQGNVLMESDATTPVFNPIHPQLPNYVRAYCYHQKDLGKTITLFGEDENGQPLTSTDSNNIPRDGYVLTLGNPWVQTPMKVRRIFRVLKDCTVAPVRLYQFDAANNLQLDLAVYQPTETSPSYIHTRLRGQAPVIGNVCGQTTPVCDRKASLDALVKLQFIPVCNDYDLVLIQNLDAIQDMILSIRMKGEGNKAASEEYELSAFKELQYQQRDRFPIEQFTCSFNPYGTARLDFVTGGFI